MSWGQECSLRMAVPCLRHGDGETGGTLPAAPLPRRFFFLTLCQNQDACQQTTRQALASVLALREKPGRSAVCPCILEPAGLLLTMPSIHPEQTSGKFLAVQRVLLLCLKMRSTWKLPFLCCKEDTPASWATAENHPLPLRG